MTLSDTVGFIRDLPHKLVEAFQATLQEATDADLLLHVVDAASPLRDEQMAEVETVLREIGAEAMPQVLVFNKIDRFEPSERPRELRDEIEQGGGVRRTRVFVSARDGEGLDVLRQVIAEAACRRPPPPAVRRRGAALEPGADSLTCRGRRRGRDPWPTTIRPAANHHPAA